MSTQNFFEGPNGELWIMNAHGQLVPVSHLETRQHLDPTTQINHHSPDQVWRNNQDLEFVPAHDFQSAITQQNSQAGPQINQLGHHHRHQNVPSNLNKGHDARQTTLTINSASDTPANLAAQTTTARTKRPYKKRKTQQSKVLQPTGTPASSTRTNQPTSDSEPSSHNQNVQSEGPDNLRSTPLSHNHISGAPTLLPNNITHNVPPSQHQANADACINTINSLNRPALPDDLAQDLEVVDLYDLRLHQHLICKNKRLTQKIKDDLKEITLEYQKKIHLLALQHKIRSEILFKWIGIWNKVRGPNRFNNYCRYAPDARRLFDSIPPSERMQQVAEQWRSLDDEEQLKYNDWDFINMLRQKMGLQPVDNPEEVEDEDQAEAAQLEGEEAALAPRKSDSQVLKHCKDWAKKVAVDMNFFSNQYQVEGFFIITSTDYKGRVFISGGSFLGQDYMQLRKTKDDDPWRGFRLWATGIATDAKLCGVPVDALCKKRKRQAIQVTSSNPQAQEKQRVLKGLWDTGLAKTNKPKMTTQLRELLAEASGGVWSGGWPREKGRELFQKWGLKLHIDPRATKLKEEYLLGFAFKNAGAGIVDIILEALHNSWIKVTDTNETNETNNPNVETTSPISIGEGINRAEGSSLVTNDPVVDPHLDSATLV
ncbi:hypothetical protein PGT21_032698 [Puccinia graminis f. sp. tritici]|uniref:HMG box domain-containing protein n=1 Tax=Puccinia graminis f. sp. tritici TaxID=56615 RepID=A0A5B0LZ16_PUCGR|nr:hypothetical protein PGT21_032698 [Puccinia graminis f. sp. tritici]